MTADRLTDIDELIEEFRRTWMDFGMAESAPMYDPGRRYKRQAAEDSTEALKAAIERLQAENVALHEQVAALESREVCTVAHDDVETCGYCQRDALRAEVGRLRDVLLRLMTNPAIDLGDQIYTVREREGHGWDGPAVKAWSDAVSDAKKLIEDEGRAAIERSK